jgi:hypothetical protein
VRRLIHILAAASALLVLVTGLWNDWSFWLTLKRLVTAYVGAALIGSAFALAVHWILALENKTTGPASKVSGRETGAAPEPANSSIES